MTLPGALMGRDTADQNLCSGPSTAEFPGPHNAAQRLSMILNEWASIHPLSTLAYPSPNHHLWTNKMAPVKLIQGWLTEALANSWIPHDPRQTLLTQDISQSWETAASFPKMRTFLGWVSNHVKQKHRILQGAEPGERGCSLLSS